MPVSGPQEPPLLAAFRAGSILSGQSDKQLKEREAAAQSSSRSVTDDQSHQTETASTSKNPAGRKNASPLSRILRLRLDAASSLLSGVIGWQDISERLQSATEDDLHGLTAEASLLCLQRMKREHYRSSGGKAPSSEEQPLGARDRKSFTTLLSLASQWGFGPALLSYDAAFATLTMGDQDGPKLEDVQSQEKRREQASSDFAAAREGLSRIFALAFSVFDADEEGPRISPFDIEFILTPQQAISGQLLASAIRLAMGPEPTHSEPAPPQNAKGRERPPAPSITQSRQLLALLLRELPASSLLPMLSSVTATPSTPDWQQQPQTPPFVKQFANRVLSAQLLRRQGVSSLISTVMGIGSEGGPTASASGAAQVSSTRKLDRLVRLLVTPPPRLPQEQFLSQHILPSLLYFLLGDGDGQAAASAQAREAFASVASHTFHHLLSKHEPLLRTTLGPLIWDSLLRQCPLEQQENTSERRVVSDATNIQKSIALVELLVLYAPAYAPEWVRWVVGPISTRLWDLLEGTECHNDMLSAGGKKVSEVTPASKAKSRKINQTRDQVAGILRRWLKSETTTSVLSFLRSLRGDVANKNRGTHPTMHFQFQDDGSPVLVYGQHPGQSTDNFDADQIMAQLSSGMSHTVLADSSSTDDREDMEKSLQLMASLQGGTKSQSRPLPTVVCKMLHSASRSDVAALLLPQLLEEYIAVKSQSDSSVATDPTRRLLSSLQLIVAILDSFGEDIVKKDPDQALRFVNICLGEGGGHETSKQDTNQVPMQNSDDHDDIPFISVGAQKGSKSSSAMDGLLNASEEASQEDHNGHAHEAFNDADAADEEVARMAIDLLLSVLESNPAMSTHTMPLLGVIERKLSCATLSASKDQDLRRVVKEARVVLLARSEKHKKKPDPDAMPTIGKPNPTAQAQKEVTDQYEEALKLLQDPIVPVRAHGLDILKDVAALCVPISTSDKNSSTAATAEKHKAAKSLLPSLTNLLLGAVEDEESYLYLSAIRGLKHVMLCGDPWLGQLADTYACAPLVDSPSTSDVDKKLRIGEALLDAVQTLGEAGSKYSDSILPPLLRGLRNAQLPTTLRSSILSLLGTCVEAFPTAFAHARSGDVASELTEACVQILTLESVARPNDPTHGVLREQENHHNDVEEDQDEEMSPEELKRRLNYAPGADDLTGTDTSLPQLRRGALLLLNLLIGGATAQLEVELESQQNRDQFEAEHGALQALRLPGGGLLPRLSSAPGSSQLSQQGAPLAVDSLLFSPRAAPGVRRVLRYVRDNDTDALVRHQAGEGLEAVDGFELALVRLGLHA